MKRWIGLVLIAGGVLFLLANLDIFEVDNLIDYLWPSALILLGLASMADNRRITVWGMLLVATGGLFLAEAFNLLYGLDPRALIGPVLVIALGFALLFGRSHPRFIDHRTTESIKSTVKESVDGVKKEFSENNYSSDTKARHSGSRKTYTSFLGGLDERINDNAFTECEVTAFLGGADMDFRDIKFAGDDATLTLNSVFGSIECLLPRDIRIIPSGTPVLGSFENRCVSDPNAVKTLYIRYTAMFGVVEIKN
jgi:predicted membrane protein